MNIPKVIVDSNVLVSGMMSLSRRIKSPAAKILYLMINVEITGGGPWLPFLLSEPLFFEYCEQFSKARIRRNIEYTDPMISGVLGDVLDLGEHVAPKAHHASPDLKDNHVWDLLLDNPDSVLITGERLLCENPPASRKNDVVRPRDFDNRYVLSNIFPVLKELNT